MDQVRGSIVRICFDWKDEKGYEVMVLAGVIISIEDGHATILAHAAFFKMNLRRCVINFPNPKGYEDDIVLTNPVLYNENLCTFKVRTNGSDYIKPVKFEKQPVKVGEDVNAFVFPREKRIAPGTYPGGFIANTSETVFIHDCKMHEYGYLGSPIFNRSGHLIGITFLDKGHLQAYNVLELQSRVLEGINCGFVLNGQQTA